MNVAYKKLIAALALVLILAPIIPMVTLTTHAAATVVDYGPTINGYLAVTPGSTLWVKVQPNTGNVLIKIVVANKTGKQVWATSQLIAQTAGVNYTLSVQLPKVLPYIGDGELNVTVYVAGTLVQKISGYIIPVIEISPSATTNVKVLAPGVVAPNNITIKGYGFPKGATISKIVILNTTYADNIVNLSSPTLTSYKYWTLPTSVNAQYNGTIDITNVTEYQTSFSKLSPTPYLPRGTYIVYADFSATYPFGTLEKGATLQINPSVVISPSSGHGKDSDVIDIIGYGFDANTNITKIEFINQNFTGVKYVFTKEANISDLSQTRSIKTNASGMFYVTTNPQSPTEWRLYPPTNMTAGMYIVSVTWTRYDYNFSTSTLTYYENLNLVNGTVRTPVKTSIGKEIIANATIHLNATTKYVIKNVTQVTSTRTILKFTYGPRSFTLVADASFNASAPIRANVTFYLYDSTTTPLRLLKQWFVQNATIDNTTSPYYIEAWAAFTLYVNETYSNVTSSTSNSGLANLSTLKYLFVVQYWGNVTQNVGNVNLWEKSFIIYKSGSYVDVTYNNTDTGTVKNFHINATTTPSLVLESAINATVTFNKPIVVLDGRYNVSINLEAKLQALSPNSSTVTLSVSVSEEEMSQNFTDAAYIVRPYLEVVTSGLIKPGNNVIIVAYGYAPGKYGGKINNMTLMWDETLPLQVVNATKNIWFSGNIVQIGKDGNVTFVVHIPNNAKFGAHYIRGKDSFGYEYTLMLIVGLKSFWIKVTGITKNYIVTASHPEYGRIVASICGNYTGKCFCNVKVSTGNTTDYLGDIIKIVLYGVKEDDIKGVYFGNILLGLDKLTMKENPEANTVNISFVVPPVPAGEYPLKVLTTTSVIPIVFYNGTEIAPEVVPKILLVSLSDVHKLPILVGPGFVRVIGTGFPPGVSILSVAINGTDAISALNAQVGNWHTNADGVLVAQGGLEPALYIPALQPGRYEISLVFSGTSVPSQSGIVYVVNNLSKVVTSDEFNSFANNMITTLNSMNDNLTKEIIKAVDELKSPLNDIVGTVSSISSQVSSISSSVSSLATNINGLAASISEVSSDVKDLKGMVSDLKSSISTVLSDTAAIKGDLATLKNMVSNIKLSVDLTPITSKLNSISSQLSDIKSSLGKLSKLDELDTINSNVQSAISAANAAKSSADAAKSAAEAAGSAISNVKTELASKIDSATYVLYVATIFALLAFIFGILSWATARKAAAS